ncbi:MAG: hypothetical protein JSS76_08455 [Bacteroidetes bacterium]|nr:hypothetical protein [Bacteroidota bacterium]
MRPFIYIIALSSMLLSACVANAAPPDPGGTGAPKKERRVYIIHAADLPQELQLRSYTPIYELTCFGMAAEAPELPVVEYGYVAMILPLYESPYVERPQAFYARSTC